MNEQNPVDTIETDSVQDDAALDSTQETTTDTEGVVSLSDLLSGTEEESTETAEEQTEETQDAETEQQPVKEEKVSGGIKGRLLAENKKGYEAGRQAAMAEMQQQMQALQAQVDRLSQYELREKAAAIAKEQNVSNDVAMFLAKHGFGASDTDTPAETKPTQARDPQTGRFVSNQQTAQSSDERAQFLFAQAQDIKRMSGVDPVELLKTSDAETRARIARGEIDFFDLVRDSQDTSPKKSTPPRIKSSTVSTGKLKPGSMTFDDIDRLNEHLMKGGRVDTNM